MASDLHKKYIGPAVAVDTVVFTIIEGKLNVLMLKIVGGDYDQKWCLPGGLVQLGESPESTAIRVLKDKTNIKSGYLEQLYTFGNPNRDIRGQVISVAYLLLVRDNITFGLNSENPYGEIKWMDINKIPETAFDHRDIVSFAATRLKSKLSYSNVASTFLPDEFSITAIKEVYEAILGKKIESKKFVERLINSRVIVLSSDDEYRFENRNINYFLED